MQIALIYPLYVKSIFPQNFTMNKYTSTEYIYLLFLTIACTHARIPFLLAPQRDFQILLSREIIARIRLPGTSGCLITRAKGAIQSSVTIG